jgi:hypothetical protein
LANNQFRLLYHLNTLSPTTYRLQASNPGQFYDNIFSGGTPGDSETLTMTIPYPWVTQGAKPIQVHPSVGTTIINGQECFVPGPDITGTCDSVTTTGGALSPSGNPIIVLGDYNPEVYGSTTEVVVTCDFPATGLLYVTIHLDYGLKGTTGYAKNTNANTLAGCMPSPNPSGDDNDAVPSGTGSNPGPNKICDGQDYTFSVVNSVIDDVTVTQRNAFKKNPGIAGSALQQSTTNPKANVQAVIYNSSGTKIATVTTDEDGWYMWSYKHTGKATTFTVKLPAYNQSKTVTVKSNGYAEASFVVP